MSRLTPFLLRLQRPVPKLNVMAVPKVAIVGRPNVGKSSLLNWLSGKRISVVDPTAGVTRDRVMYVLHEGDRYFEMVDTGGIGIVDSDDLSEDIERQIDLGIAEASLLLFVVDAGAGIMPLDQEVAKRLRRVKTPVLMVVNKCDSPKQDHDAQEFRRLTNAPMVCTSVIGERNRELLLDAILENLPKATMDESESGSALQARPELKIAIVGRRNAGKSTFINALAQTERMIVSEIPGTTRDSVDVRFELDGKSFIAIDTPGVRKKKSLANDIEFYGFTRAQRSIRRADVVCMFFDAVEQISMVDKKLVADISEHYKPCIFVVNKWDLAQKEGMATDVWAKYLFEAFADMRHVPVACITGQDNRNIKQLINLAQTIAKQAQTRVSTSKINNIVRAAVLIHRPPLRANKQPKIYFGTQVDVSPPTIVLKCNYPELLDKSWLRYLLGVFREKLPYQEVPIKLLLRQRTVEVESDHASLDEREELDPLLASDEDLM